MMTMRNSRWVTISAAYAVAMVVGLGVALAGLDGAALPAVAAATHCTRYAPSISQDYQCDLYGTIAGSGYYQTPSTALRDSNAINMSASRPWALCYPGDFCSYGTGTAGGQTASTGYRAAQCWQTGSNVSGRCRTNWHD